MLNDMSSFSACLMVYIRVSIINFIIPIFSHFSILFYVWYHGTIIFHYFNHLILLGRADILSCFMWHTTFM